MAGGRVLAVQRYDAGEDGAHLLRGVEFASLLAAAGGELADEVLIGISQDVTPLVEFDEFEALAGKSGYELNIFRSKYAGYVCDLL